MNTTDPWGHVQAGNYLAGFEAVIAQCGAVNHTHYVCNRKPHPAEWQHIAVDGYGVVTDTWHTQPDITEQVGRISDHIGHLDAAVTTWAHRGDDSEPNPKARRAANDAVKATNDAITALYKLRTTLIDQIRRSDDAGDKRVDELLASIRRSREGGGSR